MPSLSQKVSQQDRNKWIPVLDKAARMLSDKPNEISQRYAELAVMRCPLPASDAIDHIKDRLSSSRMNEVLAGAMLNLIRVRAISWR